MVSCLHCSSIFSISNKSILKINIYVWNNIFFGTHVFKITEKIYECHLWRSQKLTLDVWMIVIFILINLHETFFWFQHIAFEKFKFFNCVLWFLCGFEFLWYFWNDWWILHILSGKYDSNGKYKQATENHLILKTRGERMCISGTQNC